MTTEIIASSFVIVKKQIDVSFSSSLRILSATFSRNNSYFDNEMMKLMINNRKTHKKWRQYANFIDRKTKACNQLIYVFIDLFPNFNTIPFDLSPVFCVHTEETFLSKSGTKI